MATGLSFDLNQVVLGSSDAGLSLGYSMAHAEFYARVFDTPQAKELYEGYLKRPPLEKEPFMD